MASFIALLVFLAGIRLVTAHYIMPFLIANDTASEKWQYVRPAIKNSKQPYKSSGDWQPVYDINSIDYRCARNATISGERADVATIPAGSNVGTRPEFYFFASAFHDGPLFAYLSRSPVQTRQGLQKWDGDGDYFKIAQRGPDSAEGWFTTIQKEDLYFRGYNFTIPLTTPPGFYLLRVESIYPVHRSVNHSQLYPSCAQVEIVGPGNPKTEPGPMVKFPGAFPESHPGVTVPEEVKKNWTLYEMPGPPVWTG